MKVRTIKFMLLIWIISIGLLSNTSILAQKKSGDVEKLKKEVIAEIGPEKVTYEILEKAFQKNMNRKDTELFKIPKDSIIDFLKLYSNYRLKVLDAIDRGFDKDSAVREDIKQNRKLLAETFFFEKQIINPWVKKMLEERKNEYKIAIMVFSFPPIPNQDTLETYHKARACLDLLNNNVPFESIAIDSSDDPETGRRGGEVGSWITAGNVQRPIENAILSLKPSEYYNDLIRTRYGYFLVKLLDKQQRKFVKGQHILFALDQEIDSNEVKKKAFEVLKKIKKGEDFAKLAEEYSADPNTANNGGVMEDFYSRSTGFEKNNTRLVPQFEEGLFGLKDGELSDLVSTSYGIHIIKRIASKEPNKEEETKNLKLIYKKSYFEEDKKNFYDELLKIYKYQLNDDIFQKFISFLDTNKTNLDKEWIKDVPNDFYREILFKFNNIETSVGEFVKMLSSNSELRGLGLNESGMSKALNKVITPMSFTEATKNLEAEEPEFASLMREFHDGILLFKVEQMEVWDKLKIDTVLARQYWDSTKSKYKTSQAYDFSEIYVLSDTLANELYSRLQDGADFEELATQNTQRKGYREKKGYWGEVADEANGLVRAIKEQNAKPGTILEPVKYEKGYSIIKYNKFLPVRQKTFEEAIPDFAPQVQDLVQKRLLNDWLQRIQQKFQLKIYDKKIDSVVSQMKKKK